MVGGLLLGCSSDNSSSTLDDSVVDGGSVVIAISAEPSSLLPPLASSDHEQAIVEVVYDRLADIGANLSTVGDEGFRPRLADSWRWSADSLSIAFHVDADARWHDGTTVTSEDVQRTFAVYTDPRVESANAELLANIDSVSTPDAQTATFWFKRRSPLQFYDAAYHMFIMPAHLLSDADIASANTAALSRMPVGTGRFRFANWTPGQQIEILADTGNYRERAHLDRVIFVMAPDFGSAIVKLFTGEADFFSPLRPENLAQATETPSVRVLRYPSLRFQYLGFNLRDPSNRSRPHPVLGEQAVRRALTLASNRERIVRAVFDSVGQVLPAPAPRVYLEESLALRGLPYDVDAARALLDSAGWLVSGSDSIRSKNGVRLRVEIAVPSSSVSRDRMAVLLQDQWTAIGAQVVLQRLEVPALIERITSSRYDAFMGGLIVSPGLVGLRQNWTTSAIGNDGTNFGGYSNPVVDAAVDTFLTSFDPVTTRRTLARTMQLIIDDAPGVWLVEDEAPAGINARIEPGTLTATGWWHGLPDWRIPPSRRIDRDRVGLPSGD